MGCESHRVTRIFMHFICLHNFIWIYWFFSFGILFMIWCFVQIRMAIVHWVIEWFVMILDGRFLVRTFRLIIIVTLWSNLVTFVFIITDILCFLVDFLKYLISLLFPNGDSCLFILEYLVQIVKFLWLLVICLWGYNGNETGRSYNKESNHCSNFANYDFDSLFLILLVFLLLFIQLLRYLFRIKWAFISKLFINI